VGETPSDNGIARPSEPEFTDWPTGLRRTGQPTAAFSWRRPTASSARPKAIKNTSGTFQVRDWAEFDLLNLIPVRYEAPGNYAAIPYFRFGRLPQQTDYSYAAKAGTFASAPIVRRRDGDVIVLWATESAPTDPAPPTGVAVPGD
jgi:hypothetical protein